MKTTDLIKWLNENCVGSNSSPNKQTTYNLTSTEIDDKIKTETKKELIKYSKFCKKRKGLWHNSDAEEMVDYYINSMSRKKEICDCANNLRYISATVGVCKLCGNSVNLLAN